MSQSLTNLAGAAMRIYDKNIHSQIFKKNVLLSNVLRNVAKETGASTKYMTVHYGRNVGSVAGTETVTLPTAGNQKYMQAEIPMKYNWHQVSLTDVALQHSKKSKEFLVDVLQSEYDGAKEDMKRQFSRQLYGIGTGELFKLNGNPDSAATELTVDSPMVGKDCTDYIEIGNILRFGATAANVGTVTSITGPTTFTIAANSLDLADNDIVYIAQSATQSNKDNEMMGLKGLIDDGTNVVTLQNISRATYPWWKSYVNDAEAARPVSDALLHKSFLEAKKKGEPSFGLTSFDVFSSYGQQLTPDRRYTDKMQLEGGFTGLMFNNLLIVPDYDCPFDELYFIDKSTLSIEDLGDISFLNEDGSILDRSATTPAWNATLRYYGNMAISAPNKNSALRDIN